ncbi:hypothetical protein PQR72_27730 [Paraburkholderia madseniana]|uniref:hypothetical protein n=1 Tax=Paraburkholderia madseniana TaxID=2599607 RepID=UPI0015C55924|nr:hypothetical protein [Paraburkholderia madseniana]NPT68086.1 hypothetical protein [Paraburkholderia madseniana]
MANLHPEITKWFEMANPEANPSVDPLGAAQLLKAAMIGKWFDKKGLDEAWASIAAALKTPNALVRFFIDLPERPSPDPFGRVFGRRSPGTDVAKPDVKVERAKIARYREAAETVYKLLSGDDFAALILMAQTDVDARDHVIPVCVTKDSMQEGLRHWVELLATIDPKDTIPSEQPSSPDIARKNYNVQIAEVCVKHFVKTPHTAVAMVANAIAGVREDGEEWVTVEQLRNQINRHPDKLAKK